MNYDSSSLFIAIYSVLFISICQNCMLPGATILCKSWRKWSTVKVGRGFSSLGKVGIIGKLRALTAFFQSL